MKRFTIGLICGLFLLGITLVVNRAPSLSISPKEAHQIGLQIWKNECAGKKEGLTSWNEGEEFASLGIGHFIWYPSNQTGHFKETFPDLIVFSEKQNIAVPKWLKKVKGCPWKTREEFQLAQQSSRMHELREWLFEHVDLQTVFIIKRLEKALPTMLKGLPSKKKVKITAQFYRLASTPSGLYVLIDYLNFKGEGTSKLESYQGYGWGLLQVLEGMNGTSSGESAIEEFVFSAKDVLEKRIQHSPPERKEERWRQGWYNRLDGYLQY